MTASSRNLRLLAVAATLAAPLALTACSGGMAEDAPRDADLPTFCDTFYDRTKTAREVAADLVEVGSPDDLSADERAGFELWVEGLDKLGDAPNAEVDVEVPDSERDVAEAFTGYVGDACLATPTTTTPSAAPGS